MASTLTSMHIHVVFSTKNREKLIDEQIRERLWAYLGGIARQNKMVAQAVGGTSDHVHILVTIPPNISVSRAIQLIKIGSSKWIHEEFPEKSKFSWQAGYGSFSVGLGRFPIVINYIHNQEAHHRKRTSQEEYTDFLKVNGIEYDERYVWG
jgi:putative transposase